MMNVDKKYYAKLMLAGEYGVLNGGEALTVPLKMYKAGVAHRDELNSEKTIDTISESVASLRDLFMYIRSLPKKSFYAIPKIVEMEDFLKKGFYIESDIPSGYGIGSSGAVTALVYDQFFKSGKKRTPNEIMTDLSTIESFFHGRSSGVDAMTIYSGNTLHFLPDKEIRTIATNPLRNDKGYRFFLIDSGVKMETAPLVKHYNKKLEEKDFYRIISDDYLPLISKFIKVITGDFVGDMALLFRAISDVQWNYFRPMIPESIEDAWINGQVSNTYYLKLNGSGGGFLLGIAHEDSVETTESMLEGFTLNWL